MTADVSWIPFGRGVRVVASHPCGLLAVEKPEGVLSHPNPGEPAEKGAGFVFENKVIGGSVPKEYVPGVIKGLQASINNGVIAGFPCTDFKATLYDGNYHDVDSSALAFEIAARAAVREALPKAGPKLLEPIMKVEVVTPEDYMGDVIGDLNSRRGQVNGMDSRGNARVINAMVPRSEEHTS